MGKNKLSKIKNEWVMCNHLRLELIDRHYTHCLKVLEMCEDGNADLGDKPLKKKKAKRIAKYVQAYTTKEYSVCWRYVLKKLAKLDY